MKAKNISVHLYPYRGELKVWCASFDLKGDVPRNDKGVTDQTVVRKIERAIEKVLAEVEFPDA